MESILSRIGPGRPPFNRESVARIGIGSIWFGRPWPPGNDSWSKPGEKEIDQYLSQAFRYAGREGSTLILDTAQGYAGSEAAMGHWLQRFARGREKNALICTKFGELFSLDSGDTRVDLSAQAAEKALLHSQRLLGRVDLLYSHVTSQLTPEEAQEALSNEDLLSTLEGFRREGSVSLLGCSLSHESVLERGLSEQASWLQQIDVLQLPTTLCLRRPDLVEAVARHGVAVIANSPVRCLSRLTDELAEKIKTPHDVFSHLLRMRGISTVLTGTRTHLEATLSCDPSYTPPPPQQPPPEQRPAASPPKSTAEPPAVQHGCAPPPMSQEDVALLEQRGKEILREALAGKYNEDGSKKDEPGSVGPGTPRAQNDVGLSVAELKAAGNRRVKAGGWQEAAELYSRALELADATGVGAGAWHPESYAVLGNRSLCHMKLGRWPEAKADAEEAVRRNRHYAKGFYRLALCKQKLADLAGAWESITTAAQLDGADPAIRQLQREIHKLETGEDLDSPSS